jgi:hypothetical protein
MPRTDRNQTFDQSGNLIEETLVQVPVKVISDELFTTAKQQIRGFVGTYWNTNTQAPIGTLTITDARNWLLALTVIARYSAQELDDEG